jgi:dTDP-4-dehydrorhamnose reductase
LSDINNNNNNISKEQYWQGGYKNWQGAYENIDVTNKNQYKSFCIENKINTIIHLASLKSYNDYDNYNNNDNDKSINYLEQQKLVNIDGVHNALDIAKETKSK